MRTRSLSLIALAAATVVAAGGSSAATSAARTYPRAIVYGTEGGGSWLSTQETDGPLSQFLAYTETSVGGLHVASADVTGDGKADVVTGPGWGGRGELRVFDGNGRRLTPTVTAQAFGPGVQVAAGDVNGDGKADLIAGNDRGGGPNVQVFDAVTGKRIAFFGAYQDQGGQHGIRVAAGDVNGDGRAEIVTGDDRGIADARVRVYSATQADFFPAPLFSLQPFGSELLTYGLQVAAGDVTGDRHADLIVAGETSFGPSIKVYDGSSAALLGTFSPFERVATESLRVAAGDLDGDGRVEIVAAGDTIGGPAIRAFTAAGAPLFALPGIALRESIAVGDLDGDGEGEIVATSGPSSESRAAVLDRSGLRTSFTPYEPFDNNGVRVAVGDLNGDGNVELVSSQGPGNRSEVDVFDRDGNLLRNLHPFAGATSDGAYVAAGDVNGDRKADVVVGADAGGEPRVKVYDGGGRELASFLALDPAFRGGVRVATGDLDGDGRAEIIAGSGPGGPPVVRVFDSAGRALAAFTAFGPFDTGGVFVAGGDVDGDGKAEIVVGAGSGMAPYVRVFDPVGQLQSQFLAYEDGFAGSVRVAVGDVDRDGEPEIVTSPGPGRPVDINRFRPSGALLWSFRVHNGFEGGLYVALQAAVGPRLQASGIDWITREGESAGGQWATFEDLSGGLPDDYSATISWGDGSQTAGVITSERPGFYSVRATKAYRHLGIYPITVRISDRFLRLAVTHASATVLDAPLAAYGGKLHALAGRALRSRVAVLVDGNPLAQARDYSATIRWGDGSSSRGRLARLAAGRFAVIGGHKYRRPGHYVARISVSELGIGTVQAQTIVLVRAR